MNANELAVELEHYLKGEEYDRLVWEIPDLLRQQQAEIAELKHMNKNWQISENILLLELEKLQQRELTDEEIIAEAENHDWLGLTSESEWQPEIDFAKAILIKAQEK